MSEAAALQPEEQSDVGTVGRDRITFYRESLPFEIIHSALQGHTIIRSTEFSLLTARIIGNAIPTSGVGD